MEGWVCLLLLLQCTAVTVSQNCTQEGAVEIIGTVTPTLIAGRMEICVDGLWRAVYDEGWDITEASIVCQQRGFPPERARACTGSCFGDSPLTNGYHYQCGERANALSECPRRRDQCCCERYLSCSLLIANQNDLCCVLEFAVECRKLTCQANAGVVCTKPVPTSPTSATENNSNTDLPTLNTPATPPQCNCSTASINSTTTIILGVVSAVLLFILLGVVLGWVWFCCTVKWFKEPHQMELNPSYITSSSPPTTIQTQPNQCYEKTTPTPLYESVITDREDRN